jgi:hypothetical protein
MPVYRITYRPYAAPRQMLLEDVVADELRVDPSGLYTLTRQVLVMNRPRTVVVRRVHVRDLGGAPVRLCPVASTARMSS